MYRTIAFVITLFLIPAAIFAADADPVVAQVNQTPITRSQLYAEYQNLLPLNSYHRRVSPEDKNSLLKKALDSLIEKRLKLLDAEKKGLSVPKQELDAGVQEVIAGYPSPEAYRKKLEEWHVTDAGVRDAVRRKKLIQAAYQKEVVEAVHVDEASARKYYDANRSRFVQPMRMHLREILVKVPALSTPAAVEEMRLKAENVQKEIRGGLSFEDAAKKYSDAPNKDKGGDMGLIHKGVLDPEAEKEVLAGKPGDIFGPFQAFQGFVILKLEEILPQRLSPFDEIRTKLIHDLTLKETAEGEAAWIRRLKENAKIVILDAQLQDKKPEQKNPAPSDPL